MENNIKLLKKQKRLRLIFLSGIYVVLAAIISTSILFYINYCYLSKMNNSGLSSVLGIPSNSNLNSKQQTQTVLTCDTENISFSFDNKYCMYIINGKVYIKEIHTNRIKHEISEDFPISKALLLDDRNIIVYFTMSKVGTIDIKTYNIDKNETTEQKIFKVNSGSSIKQVGYSSVTGFIYINVESKNNGVIDKIYYITLMKRLGKLTTQKIVNNEVWLNKTLTLYYQNADGNLFCNSKKISRFANENIRLLGRDSNDNIYVQSLIKTNTIYVLYNRKVIKTLNLEDANYLKILYDRGSIYAVYSGYVVNLTDDINKKITFSSKLSFVNIVDNIIYLRDKNNAIIWNTI